MGEQNLDRREFLGIALGLTGLSLFRNPSTSQRLYDLVWILPYGSLKDVLYVGKSVIFDNFKSKFVNIQNRDIKVLINATENSGIKRLGLVGYIDDGWSYDMDDIGLDDSLDLMRGEKDKENFIYTQRVFYDQQRNILEIIEPGSIPEPLRRIYSNSSKKILDYLLSQPEVKKHLNE